DQHYAEIRTLEQKLAALEASAGQCKAFADPGDDPPFGDATGGLETQTSKWSDEETRGRVFEDIVRMAFVCDLSRVAMFQLTFMKCYMNMYPVSGQFIDMHGCTHNGVDVAADAIGWSISHFARLVAKLKGTIHFNGRPWLDNGVLVLDFEGGVGQDPESGSMSNAHSTENMCMLVAGGAGGIKGGRHVDLANQAHPAQVVLTAMNAVGANASALGE